jgi:RNA polymerase sigma factor (sigma-70 family)
MTEMEPTRVTLLQRLCDSRDEMSWQEFIDAYERYIYLVTRGMNIGHHDAEDITQAVVLSIWKKIPTYKYTPDSCKFRSWISRIVRNRVIDHIRASQAKKRNIDFEEFAHHYTEPEVEQIAEREWCDHVADRAWAVVKERFSEHILQCFELDRQGLSTEDICKKLDLKKQAVYSYRQKVKEALLKEYNRLDQLWS